MAINALSGGGTREMYVIVDKGFSNIIKLNKKTSPKTNINALPILRWKAGKCELHLQLGSEPT